MDEGVWVLIAGAHLFVPRAVYEEIEDLREKASRNMATINDYERQLSLARDQILELSANKPFKEGGAAEQSIQQLVAEEVEKQIAKKKRNEPFEGFVGVQG